MDKRGKAVATGTIVGRHRDVRGAMISVAVTLPLKIWEELTDIYDEFWEEAQDDLFVRDLSLEDRIALFVGDAADSWCSMNDGGELEGQM